GKTLRVAEYDHLFAEGVGNVFAGASSDNMHVEGPEEGARGVEERGGIVVAGDDDDVTAGGAREAGEEAVVQFLRAGAGRAGVEHVAGDEQHVDAAVADGGGEPVEK